MSDSVRLACSAATFDECLELAKRHGAGLEIQTFAQPDILDGSWRELVSQYLKLLRGFDNGLSMHGAFFDLVSSSPDRQVVQLAYDRYVHNLRIADMLGATQVVYHMNYIASIHHPAYRPQWTERQIEFWGKVLSVAEPMGITVLLENMWEYDPRILGDVLDAINSPFLKTCIDVGHVYLYSDLVLENWIEALERHFAYTHLNNNPGAWDEHCALDEGVLDYQAILTIFRQLPNPPTYVLELPDVELIRRSLQFFNLDQADQAKAQAG